MPSIDRIEINGPNAELCIDFVNHKRSMGYKVDVGKIYMLRKHFRSGGGIQTGWRR
ncbi:hypothetical protein [Paraeggerthella sp.]|uniref:hypothetical protein n=1 Tax=Paraeggerthella sp. TaxID=2897350 RepID=UPI003527C03C